MVEFERVSEREEEERKRQDRVEMRNARFVQIQGSVHRLKIATKFGSALFAVNFVH